MCIHICVCNVSIQSEERTKDEWWMGNLRPHLGNLRSVISVNRYPLYAAASGSSDETNSTRAGYGDGRHRFMYG